MPVIDNSQRRFQADAVLPMAKLGHQLTERGADLASLDRAHRVLTDCCGCPNVRTQVALATILFAQLNVAESAKRDPPDTERSERDAWVPISSSTAHHKYRGVIMLVADLDVRILTEEGEVLRHLTIDPTKNYQAIGRT